MSSVSAETKQLSLLGPTFHGNLIIVIHVKHFFLIFGIFSIQQNNVHITALVSIWLITNEVCTTCIIKFEEMF